MADEKKDNKISGTEDIFHKAVENMQQAADQESNNSDDVICEYDELKLYFGEDYKVNNYITIYQPTIGDIIEFGEKRTYSSIMPFTVNPTSYRLQLWDIGIDWNDIKDFMLFIMLVQNLKQEDTELIFGDIDFTKFKAYTNSNTDEIILIHEDNEDFQIDEHLYLIIRSYIRKMFNINPKTEKAKGKITKQSLIDEDRINLMMEQRKNKGKANKSMLLPLISALLNHPGFKYKKNELKEVGIVEFMDSVQRLQVYESTRALMQGMYSGMIDTSKMNLKDELNWFRDLDS